MLRRLAICLTVASVTVSASGSTAENEAKRMHITCYTSSPNAHTYSGQIVHEGGCAGRKEDLGKHAYLYTEDTHELYAVLEINDIGGHYQLRNGTALDIWMPSLEACWDWVGDYGDYSYVVIK